MRCLFFFTAKYNFVLVAKYIPGISNTLVDALSRNKLLLPRSPGQTFCYTHPTKPTGGPGPQEARLDFTGLDSLVHHYFQFSLAPSTQQAYMCGKKRYLMFCLCNNTSPLPVVESTLCYFVATLAQEGLTHNTIRSYLSAVKHLSIELQGTDPFQSSMPHLEHILRGIKSEQAKRSPKPRTHLPITPSILHSISRVWELNSTKYDNIMLWAACCLCYFGFLRAGEICVPSASEYVGAHLSYGDIAVDSLLNPWFIEVNIKASKTDPFRTGVKLFIGRTGNALCPVSSCSCLPGC